MIRRRQARPGRAAMWLGVCLVLAAAPVGCGSKSKTNELSGKVTYNGEPVTGGKLNFYPVDGKGTAYPVPLQNDGTYVASGIPKGKMKVTVDTAFLKNRPKGPPPGVKASDWDGSNAPAYKAVPHKYAIEKTTPLGCEVKGGKQQENFDLSGKLP